MKNFRCLRTTQCADKKEEKKELTINMKNLQT